MNLWTHLNITLFLRHPVCLVDFLGKGSPPKKNVDQVWTMSVRGLTPPPLIFKSYGHGETLFKNWLYWPYNTYIWCYIGYTWCYIGYIGPIMARYWLFMAIYWLYLSHICSILAIFGPILATYSPILALYCDPKCDVNQNTLPKPSCLLSRPFWTFGKPQRVHLLRVLLS